MRNGISKEMRTQVSLQQDVRRKYSYNDFVEVCKDRQLRLDLDRPSFQSIPFTMQCRNPQVDLSTRPPRRADFATIPSSKFTPIGPISSAQGPATGSNLVPPGEDPMILDKASLSYLGPDEKLTSAERKRRYELNLCMRCGKFGHKAIHCRPNNSRLLAITLGKDVDDNPNVTGKK